MERRADEQQPELRVVVRISPNPVSDAERLRRLRSLHRRLEALRRERLEAELRGGRLPAGM